MPPPTLRPPTVAGRTCDACTVCCIAPTIEDPALFKPQGEPCAHLAPTGGCGIYAQRPTTCRRFECGWKRFQWVKPGLRPDLSRVFIRTEDAPGQGAVITVSLLDERALEAEGLAETVAAAVAAGHPVYLSVPGPPGYTATTGRIDEAIRPAVLRRDKRAVLDALAALRRQAEQTGGQVPIRSLR